MPKARTQNGYEGENMKTAQNNPCSKNAWAGA